MPKYRALSKTWLSHECRLIEAGAEFETTFPKVKIGDKEVEMKLSDNIELVTDKPEKPGKSKADDLV